NVERTLIEHWNGTNWTIVTSANNGADFNTLTKVAVVSSNDIWAGGYYRNGAVSYTLIEHWNGSSWSIVRSASVGSNSNGLKSMAAVAANDIWAVGSYEYDMSTTRTLIEHWNGSAWSIVPSPNAGTDRNELVAVAAGSGVAWASGWSMNGSIEQTLALQWNG